jgi:hypothetical protein
MVSNDMAAKTLREKCVSGNAMKMIGHLEDWTRSGRPWTRAMRGKRNIWFRH